MLSRTAALLALVALTTLLAPNSASAQQLKMPSDPLAGTVLTPSEPAPTAVQLTPGDANVVPSGGDVLMSNGSMSNGTPSSMYSSGAYYNPTLGSHVRATYTTQSYGQEAGQLSLGTMKLFQGIDGLSFIDGQVTLNDESNVGYNLGIGYRWMTLPLLPFSPDSQKIMGVSLWSDGLSKGDGTFFPQVGVSLESLGDHIDFRANGYAPVGEQTQSRDFFQTGNLSYSGNSIATQLQGVADTALTIGEVELAGRIADLDAWVFGGAYGFNGGAYDGAGGKVGLRGYATPDLMLSVAIANDNEFDTNALVNLTWFIGRTRAENCPRGELSDRFREPVLRNNYVALQQSTVFAAGGPLLDANGDPFRVFHADSTAGPGGDGTFQNPVNSLNELTTSQEGDIVLAHGGSVFNGQSAALKDQQLFIGEGGNNPFSVTQFGGRTFNLPETAPGALAGPVPQINNSVTAGVVLADNNTVRNLSFSGGTNAITSNTATGSHNTTLRDLTIANTTGPAINLVAVAGADEYDVDNDDNTTETVNLLGTVVIDDVEFSGNGGNDIAIIGGSALAGTKIAEVITIRDVTTTGSTAAPSIAISNTVSVTGSTTNITNYSYNGGTTSNGGVLLTNTGSATTITGADFTGGDGPALAVNGSTGTVTVDGTTTIDDVAGRAVSVIGNTATVNIGATIKTDAPINGGGVFVQRNEGIVSFTGAITANGVNAAELDDTKANVTFGTAADITHTGAGNAMVITNAGSNTTNTAQVTVNGDITNAGGRSVQIVDGDGAITFNGIISDTGTGISITDRENVGTALTVFNGQTTLTTGANDALTLTNNGADSVTTFSNLDITTTGIGRGIVALNGGTLNMNTTGATNTISTQTGRAIDITGGSSGLGLVFQSVNVNGADQAIDLNDFNGTVTVNGGTMTTTGVTVEAQNASLVLDEVILNSTVDNDVISATVTGTTARTITLTDIDANGDDVDFRTNVGATGALTVSINNDESTNDATGEIGSVTFDSNGSGNSSLSMTDVRTDAGFDYDVDGAGNLSVTMTNVTSSGNGNTTLDVTSTGDALLTMSNVNTGGAITATSSGASDGDMIINATNSGNTEAFTNIQVNDQGDGVATTTLTNVTSTGGVDFDSAGAGAASLTVAGGTYGGAGINASATNNDSFTTTISGTTNVTAGDVTFNAQNTGAATFTKTGTLTVTSGDINVTAGNSVTTANVTMSGATTVTAGDVAVTATNNGALTTNLSGITTTAGGLAISKTTTGNASYTLSNLTLGTGASINSANTGTIAFSMQGVTSTATGATDAVSLVVGPNVTTGDIDFFGTNNFTAVGGSALDVDILGGDVDFRVANGTFTNNSATNQTVAISAGGTAVVDATVTGNTGRNTNAASPVEFLIETLAGGSPTLNLNLSGNSATESGGPTGNGQILMDENSGTFRVFELTDTSNNVGNRNNATIQFDPNVAAFDNLASPPSLPFQ